MNLPKFNTDTITLTDSSTGEVWRVDADDMLRVLNFEEHGFVLVVKAWLFIYSARAYHFLFPKDAS